MHVLLQLGFAVCFIWNLSSESADDWASWMYGIMFSQTASQFVKLPKLWQKVTFVFCMWMTTLPGKNENNLHGGEINFGATIVLRMQLCIQTTMGHQAGIIHIFQCLIQPGSFCISSSMYFAFQLQWRQLEHVSLFSYIKILAGCVQIKLMWINRQTKSCSKNQCRV